MVIKGLSLSVLFLSTLLISSSLFAKEVVRVGGYQFPPFVEVNGQHSGLTLELVELFNRHQNDVTFQFVNTSPKRRYADFVANRFDLLFFESMLWGWKNHEIEASKVFLTGGEVYITNKKRSQNEKFFDQLKEKKLVGVLGYHYGFADFNSDTNFLMNKFDIRLVSSPESILRRITSDKSDVGVVTLSYLNAKLLEEPELNDQLFISKRFDQKYEHTILARKNGMVSIKTINRWLNEMRENGSLKTLFSRYNLHKNMK